LKNILVSSFLIIILSVIIPLQYSTVKIANGQVDNTIANPIKSFPTEKPKIDVDIEGTVNNDKIKGGDGDDKINGAEGNDILSGGKGDDKLNGGNGDDTLNGEYGNDKMKGGLGNDKITGERGNDTLDGGKGDDRLFGGKNDDELGGGEGNDILDGGEGADIMKGGAGADTFTCDQFDTIVDFNSDEGDQVNGSCSPEDHAVPETIIANNSSPSSQFNPGNRIGQDLQPQFLQ
jgi:Ca2+-binding RTX toxin-like protein